MENSNVLHTEILRKLGQRIRLYIINCENHWDTESREYFEKNKAHPNIDYFKERPKQILTDLKYSMYIPYACILILINTDCDCGIQTFMQVLANIKLNRHLRYKTKLIIAGSLLNGYYSTEPYYSATHSTLKKYSENSSISADSFLKPPLYALQHEFPTFEEYEELPVVNEHDIFLAANLENAVFMKILFEEPSYRSNQMDWLLLGIDKSPLISMDELFLTHTFHDFVAQSSTNADYYFYTINPALAIIINNYYFTNDLGLREGSEKDVRRLIRQLKINQIPFILIQDCSREELLQIRDYIKQKDFQPLKSFQLFLMSHGDSDNVLYTHDGQLNLFEDIVKPIQANKSLENAEKFIIVNICRGSLDMEYADFKDLQQIKQIKPTDARFLHDKTVLLYSVPDCIRSPRDSSDGSPFMQSVCQSFVDIDHTKDILMIHEKIDKNLEEVGYYEGLQAIFERRSELVIRNAGRRHCIIQSRIKSQEVIKLMESIKNEFSAFQVESHIEHEETQGEGRRQRETLFCICDSLKKMATSSEISFKEKYFSANLDKDCRCGLKKN